MKRLSLLVLPLLFWLPQSSYGQEEPRAEIFGGYSFFRADTFDYVKTNLNGWNASAAGTSTAGWVSRVTSAATMVLRGLVPSKSLMST